MKKDFSKFLLFLPVIFGAVSLILTIAEPSEAENARVMGLSPVRLLLAAASVILILFSLSAFRLTREHPTALYYAAGIALLLSLEILIFSRFPSDDSRNLLPLITSRALPLLTAVFLSGCTWFAVLSLTKTGKPPFFPFSVFTAAVLLYMVISGHIDRYNWMIDLRGNNSICLTALTGAFLWYLTLKYSSDRRLKTAAGCLFFAVLGFSVTRLTGLWMDRVNTPSKAYWNELAESFLAGRLDLLHPTGFHDLTQYNGKWYVPNPPMPGILLIPWVALLGSAEAVNTSIYSAVVSGINAGLFFLMLIMAFTRSSGPLFTSSANDSAYPGRSLSVSVWVTILFVFGTDHLWLGTTGQMWFISQLLVITFTLLACIGVICGCSPFLAGAMLGMGMMCRPNIFPIFLCLLGIYLGQQKTFSNFSIKKVLIWCLKCGIPVLAAAGLLLLYNKLRFGSWMDFGYTTINGADWILRAVSAYGMFHPHFFMTNLKAMFLNLPRLDLSGERFFFQPYLDGYSIFLMTPPLLYVFRSFRKDLYTIGAWASVLLTVILLLFYHNTGAEQIGYRYILDAAAPLALLTAQGTRQKISVLFKILTVFAVLISFTGIYWWYRGRI